MTWSLLGFFKKSTLALQLSIFSTAGLLGDCYKKNLTSLRTARLVNDDSSVREVNTVHIVTREGVYQCLPSEKQRQFPLDLDRSLVNLNCLPMQRGA